MSRRRGRGPFAMAAGLLALAASTAHAQVAPQGELRERTGPMAAPAPLPGYARPAPGALPLSQDQAPPITAPPGAGKVIGIRVSHEGPPAAARPPPGWRPSGEPDADLQLDYRPGEVLDEAWVRRQFALNKLPDGDAGRPLALVQLINRAVLAAGYLNSGLLVRASNDPGVLELQMVYGAVSEPVAVTWTGGRSAGLDAAYVRDRLPAARQRPLSAIDLERDFRLLAEDPALRTINADLRPGERPGEASLTVAAYPQDRLDLYLTAANNRSPSVGGERGAVGGYLRNVMTSGDLLGGEVGLSYRFLDTPLLPIAASGRWDSARTLSAGLLLTRRISRSELLGKPFSFSAGAVDGRSAYTAARFVADYLVRNVDQVFAVSLTATHGLHGTGSDVTGAINPKTGFNAALAQINYARRLSGAGLELRARISGQAADSVLYSGERFSAGGETTVRGYRENLALADEGLIGSLELAHPLRLAPRRSGAAFDWGAFSVAAFTDAAALHNKHAPQPDHRLWSVGAALAWTPSDALSAQVTYGLRLGPRFQVAERDLQDHGIAFRVTVHPLRALR